MLTLSRACARVTRGLSVLAAMGLVACAPTVNGFGEAPLPTPLPTADAPPAPVFAEADRRLVIESAAGLVYAQEAAKLAEQRTRHPQLLVYAARVARDHAAALQDLRTLAAARGLTVPELPLPDQRTAIDALEALRGDAFDQQFLQQIGVRQHEAALRLCETIASTATDAELRAWAERQRMPLREHLAAARQLQLPAQAAAPGAVARAPGA